MVVHGADYRRLEYVPTSTLRRIWPLAAMEVRQLFKRWPTVLLFLACLGPSFGSLGMLLLRVGIWRLGEGLPDAPSGPMSEFGARIDPGHVRFYVDPVVVESFLPLVILTALVGCRAIAKDRAANALEIYWTRGVSPRGYFTGRWLGSVLLLGIPCFACPLVLWLLSLSMVPDDGFTGRTLAFMPRVLFALALYTATLAYLAVGFSALTARANQASILWVFLLLGTAAVGRVLTQVFDGETHWRALSPLDALARIVAWLVGEAADYPVGWAFGFLGATLALLTFALLRRLRLQEAIA